MTTSNHDSKLYARNTETVARLNSYTDTTNSNEQRSNSMSKQQAHKLLDLSKARAGSLTPSHLIDEALTITGDL